MKRIIINPILSSLANSYDEDKLKKIKYGLESVYIHLEKGIVLILVAYLLSSLKTLFLLILFVNILRRYAYGIHLASSLKCHLFSISVYIIIPKLVLSLDKTNLLIISYLSLISIVAFAPALTKKGRKLKKDEIKKNKIISTIIATTYCIFITLNQTYLAYILGIALLIQSIIVNPISYRLLLRKEER